MGATEPLEQDSLADLWPPGWPTSAIPAVVDAAGQETVIR